MAEAQIVEFFNTYDIIDHLPNQASGFSATLLKNKSTGEYTLAFRSTEYRDIEFGGDAQRDSIRGAAGDIAFNGMAFAQLSSMEKYWKSLLDGTRASGATPDNPGARDTAFLRTDELGSFRAAVAGGGTRINVSGYSLGGHLATLFSTFHGEQVASLYLFNSSGVGSIRSGFPATAYRDALETYEHYLQPANLEHALRRFAEWADLASPPSEMGLGVLARLFLSIPVLRNLFVPKEFADYLGGVGSSMAGRVGGLVALVREQLLTGIPRGGDGLPIVPSSALHFLVSLFASEALAGTYLQTIWRGLGRTFPSLQESGLIPSDVRIYQLSGIAAEGAPSISTFGDMLRATDWNIVADSGIRAAPDGQLLSVYIENQPVAAGVPFTDRGWGDFGNTHSITLLVDSLAVIRMLQKAQPSLPQEAAEQIIRGASNLRKESSSFLPDSALAEHDTLERVVDALGRVLFGHRIVGAIDWSRNLASADGVSSFGLLVYRDPFYGRIQAIEAELSARGLAGALEIVSLAGRSAADLVAEASATSERGKAARYALKELDPFFVVGPGLYDVLGRSESLSLYDLASGTGAITSRWLQDRADFLALKLRLGVSDHAFEAGSESILYSSATGDIALSIAPGDSMAFAVPDRPASKSRRAGYATWVENLAQAGRARLVRFGADGDPAANPSTVQGGADRLRGGAGADRLYGEGGNDEIFGDAGDDYLEGGHGDDTLFGGRGMDVLAGGSGYDTYLRVAGDGSDRITEVRESSGQMRGRVVLREGSSLLTPRVFERDEAAAGEVYRSPDRRVTLTHGATWVLAFAEGSIDLGPDLRDGDFGFQLESSRPPPPPTVLGSIVLDRDLFGADAGDPILDAGYGHDGLYSNGRVTLEDALLVANAAPVAGWGFWLNAGPGDDLAIGSAADDVVYGGGGIDTLVGGPGNDLIHGDVDFTPVTNRLSWQYAAHPDDSYFTTFVAPGFSMIGTGISDSHRDQIAEAADTIHGGGGNDRIYGDGGEDLIYGDAGDDLLLGGADADVLVGGDGADRITGEMHGYAPVPFEIVGGRIVVYHHHVTAYGDDIIDGGAGDDELIGEGGADVIFGGGGSDVLYGDIADLPEWLHGSDILDGGDGEDAIFGQGGDDVMFGGAGADLVVGDSDLDASGHGADSLYGDAGNDILVGAGGADRLDGGADDDTLFGDALDVPAAWHGADVLAGGSGDDILYGLGGADELFGADGDDRLYGDDPDSPGADAADFLDGGEGDDRLRGQGGNDRLQGGAGSDSLFGEAGDDILAGGAGADVLDGGAGDNVFEFSLGDGSDRLIAGSGAVTLVFLDGIDVPALRASRVLGTPAGIAPLQIQYSPTESITIEGLTSENQVRIRIGDAELMRASELTQLTRSAATAIAGSSASEMLLADEAHTHVFAFAGDDVLVGSEHADELHGGAGEDELHGLGGNDSLLGGEGADRLIGGAGDDRMEGGAGDDRYEFTFGEGVDSAIEVSGEGNDVVALGQGTPIESIRLRRSGNDLVITERGGTGRLFLRNWYVNEAAPGIEAIVHDGGRLDAPSIAARVIADRTLLGGAGDDTLTGDEFGDILIGSTGDDVLQGLGGDDRYVYARGDGHDRIVDTGGSDWLEFGGGIEPGEVRLVGRPDGEGGLSISLGLGAEEARIVFGEAADKRIESFQFASGEVIGYAELLRRAGGLRIEGGSGDDTVQGTFFQDSVYGLSGNDTLHGDGGNDLLIGGEGDDMLAGGANHDTYVFNAGDGRDSILEYSGMDEYLLFKGYFTASGKRAFVVDGVVFETHEPFPGFNGETFNLTLGDASGGVDTIRFGEGIAPEDIRLGLDLGKPLVAYSWLVPAAAGGLTVGTAYAGQVAYVLEIGTGGDAIELLWPNAEVATHAAATWIGDLPVERVAFGDGEPIPLGELFLNSGGLSYIRGSAGDDVLDAERITAGGWLGGGAGDDVYLRPIDADLAILEAAGGGIDTIVFGEGVASEALRLVLEDNRLFVDTGSSRVELLGFSGAAAEHALVERFELADGTTLDYEALLWNGIEINGSAFADHLVGTSVDDRVNAGAGDDRVESAGGDDNIDADAGADVIVAGAGDDWMAAGAGADVMRGGLGQDRYLYVRGDGRDVIEEHGAVHEEDTVHFAGDIAPSEIGVRREGADLVLALGTAAGDALTVRDWFTSDAMRVERVHFNDGTDWNTAALAALAGEALPLTPGDPPTDPPVTPPGEPPAVPPVIDTPVVTPPGEPPVTPPVTPPGEPPAVPPSEPPVLVDPPAVSPPADPATTASAPPVIGEAPTAHPAMPESPPTAFPSLPPAATGSSEAPADPSPGSIAAPVSPAADAGASGVASDSPAVPAATMDSLAAAGFVSPGRPSAAPADAAVEAVESDTAPPEEVPAAESGADSIADAPGADAMAAYWRWMHARLDEHLETSEVDDLGAPPIPEYRPVVAALADAAGALAPARSVGIRDRGALEARIFDGLRDGFARLG